MHTRSKTMPEAEHLAILNNLCDQESDSTLEMARLKQENMILAAEKANIQAELIFYKNELAKLCLRTHSKFPVYRQPPTETSETATVNTKLFYASQKPHQSVSNEEGSRYTSTVCGISASGAVEDQVSTTLSQVR